MQSFGESSRRSERAERGEGKKNKQVKFKPFEVDQNKAASLGILKCIFSNPCVVRLNSIATCRVYNVQLQFQQTVLFKQVQGR